MKSTPLKPSAQLARVTSTMTWIALTTWSSTTASTTRRKSELAELENSSTHSRRTSERSLSAEDGSTDSARLDTLETWRWPFLFDEQALISFVSNLSMPVSSMLTHHFVMSRVASLPSTNTPFWCDLLARKLYHEATTINHPLSPVSMISV